MSENTLKTADLETEINDGDFTFAKIIKFLKHAWLRIVIYVVAAALLTVAVMVPVGYLRKGEAYTRTRIELLFSGISTGLNPLGSTFNSDEIRDVSIIDAAIKSAGLADKLTDVDAVRSQVSITAILSSEYAALLAEAEAGDQDAKTRLIDYVFYPSKFDIQINNLNKLNITKQQSITLLDKIIEEYQIYFKLTYGSVNYFGTQLYSLDSTIYDYIDYYDIYSDQLNKINSYVTQLSWTDAGFRSTGTKQTFQDLLDTINILKINYNAYITFITIERVTNNIEQIKSKLEEEIKSLKITIEELDLKITRTIDQLKLFHPSTTTVESNGTQTIVATYPQAYYNLQATLTNYSSQLADLTIKQKNYEARLDGYKKGGAASSQKMQEADQLLQELKSISKSFVENEVNPTIEEYFQRTLISKSMRTMQPSAVITSANSMPYLPVLLIVTVAALIAACAVTQIKITVIRKSKSKIEPVVQEETK